MTVYKIVDQSLNHLESVFNYSIVVWKVEETEVTMTNKVRLWSVEIVNWDM